MKGPTMPPTNLTDYEKKLWQIAVTYNDEDMKSLLAEVGRLRGALKVAARWVSKPEMCSWPENKTETKAIHEVIDAIPSESAIVPTPPPASNK